MRAVVGVICIALLTFLISGCQSATVQNNPRPVAGSGAEEMVGEVESDEQTETDAQLNGINIYTYSTEHKKAQPMLINVLYEVGELDIFIARIKAATTTTQLESIEGMKIYRFQLEYKVSKDRESTYKDYIYIIDYAEKGYIKAIDYSSAHEVDQFTEEDIEQLLANIGYADWFIMTEPILEPILG